MLLQHPQQLHLGLQRQLADLVQEDGAPVGELEAADPAIQRSGERALDVAEELALHEPRRDRAAVDLHQWPRAAHAQVVDGPRDQLLAGAGLAGDQDGGVGRRDLLDPAQHRQQRLAAAHHLGEVVLAVDLLLQVGVLVLQPRRQRPDLLVGQHVLDGDGDLAGHLLQERDVGLGVLADPRAGHGQRADAARAYHQRHDRERAHAVGDRLGLGRILLLALEIPAHERALVLEHEPDVALGGGDLQPDDEVRRRERGLEHEQP